MNAVIETHAGDAGNGFTLDTSNGFAVDADDICKLVESSDEQSKTIRDVLKKISGRHVYRNHTGRWS